MRVTALHSHVHAPALPPQLHFPLLLSILVLLSLRVLGFLLLRISCCRCRKHVLTRSLCNIILAAKEREKAQKLAAQKKAAEAQAALAAVGGISLEPAASGLVVVKPVALDVMAGWTTFPSLMYAGHCVQCQKKMHAGSAAWGQKPAHAATWHMICSPKCIKARAAGRPAKEPKPKAAWGFAGFRRGGWRGRGGWWGRW